MKKCKSLIAIFMLLTCLTASLMIGCDKPNDGDKQKNEYAALFQDVTTDLWKMTGFVKPNTTPSARSLKSKVQTAGCFRKKLRKCLFVCAFYLTEWAFFLHNK